MNKELPIIYGFNKYSEACPDTFAPSIFLGGCNLRCPYCMNADIVLSHKDLPGIDIDIINDFVVENECEFVHISGGEITRRPTLQLINLLNEIKSWGVKISISTNGLLPYALKSIINLIDYVTIDIKTGEDRYDELYGYPSDVDRAFERLLISLSFLRDEFNNRDFNYEIRTTLYRPLVGFTEIASIGNILEKHEKWILQPFRKTKNMISKSAYDVEEYKTEEIKELLLFARNYNNSVSVKFV